MFDFRDLITFRLTRLHSGCLNARRQLLFYMFYGERYKEMPKDETEGKRSEDKKGYQRKESRREMMAKKRMRLRQLFERELIEQENLLRNLGYAFALTQP